MLKLSLFFIRDKCLIFALTSQSKDMLKVCSKVGLLIGGVTQSIYSGCNLPMNHTVTAGNWQIFVINKKDNIIKQNNHEEKKHLDIGLYRAQQKICQLT